MIYAYAWADGTLGFGKKIPEGALEVAKGSKKIAEVVCNHASDDGSFIVSVKLAYLGITERDPVDCLIEFRKYINGILNNRKKQVSDNE
jgi:hypothetical protein